MTIPVWYSGICDNILARFKAILQNFETFPSYSERSWTNIVQGTKGFLVRTRLCTMMWRIVEIQKLIEILEGTRPDSHYIIDFNKILSAWNYPALRKKKFKLIGDDLYETKIAISKEELVDIIELLESIKTGKLAKEKEMEVIKEKGKPLWT